MKRCIVTMLCLAAFMLMQSPHHATAARSQEPLQVTSSAVLYSKSTGQTVLIASLILPHSETLAGTTVTINIGGAAVAFTLDGKGNAKSLNSKAVVRLGKPTCSCKDSSHLARLSVTVKGTKAKKSVLASTDGTAPANAAVQFNYMSEAIAFDAPMTVRK